MKTLFVLPIVALLLWSQLASALIINKPDGSLVTVEQTGYGFVIQDFNKHTITPVARSGNGYVVFPEDDNATFIELSPEEKSNPNIYRDELLLEEFQ